MAVGHAAPDKEQHTKEQNCSYIWKSHREPLLARHLQRLHALRATSLCPFTSLSTHPHPPPSTHILFPHYPHSPHLSVITDSRSLDLASPNVGDYYPFSSSLVPEAFRSFHQAFYPPRPAHLQRRGGCRGLQAEFAASGSSHLMWRRCMQDLSSFLAASAQDPNQIRRALLGGPSGTGKSVAVAALVEQARTCGEVVVYVPDATALVSGGFFYRREDGTFDTIISAQHILKSVVDSHKEQLQVGISRRCWGVL